MDFVGKVVTKDLKELGFYRGVVDSFDPSTGFFKILYEDGDSEFADVSEVSRLANFDSEREIALPNPKKVGRKPKRRRRKNSRDLGKGFVDSVDDLEGIGPDLGFRVSNRGLDCDLNCDLNGRGCIDLNLSVENDEFENDDGEGEGMRKKKERSFDLNLGFNDENSDGVNGSLDFDNGGGNVACLRSDDSNDVVGNCLDSGSVGVSEVKFDVNGSNVVGSSLCEENSGNRKRRKVLNYNEGTVLRRSARRAKAAAAAAAVALSEYDTSRVDGMNDLTTSGVTDESEEKPNLERVEETQIVPPKIELPPSSTRLNLDGFPILDLFSVYSCLRSFSTLLYLSPFELEDLVEALKSKVSNLLIDFIHVSILRTLRKHLEFLANEGCESASTCLRNLNWDLLDVITWPVFMVEYLLIHGSGLKPGFTPDCLNQFDGEYYKQPTMVKVELLRCLCDDVIEVEAFKSELDKRMIMVDTSVEIDRNIINGLYRKSRISLNMTGDSTLSENVTEEVTDGNSDECFLCKMDGELICCDGCPAAYHSKCVGIVSSLLPEGDWYCPECLIGRPNCDTKPQKLIRGAELLGNDPFGRFYFSCFDYLLVSHSCDAQASCSYYYKDDLTAVIELLQSSDSFYGSILNAISQQWVIPTILHKPKIDLETQSFLMNGKYDGRKRRSSITPRDNSYLSDADIARHSMGTDNQHLSSEGSAELLEPNQSEIQSETGDALRKSTLSAKKRKKANSSAGQCKSFSKIKEDVLQFPAGDGYINCYSFARTASSIVEELLRKPSDKVNIEIPKTEEEIIAIQLKFILKKASRFSWMTTQKLNVDRQKEKCGWCYCCRFPVEGRDCLFKFTNRGAVAKGLIAENDAVLTKKNKKGHLVDLICNILFMEERLRGLLIGPWLNPHYSKVWRDNVLKAVDVSSLKCSLLMLESNLHPMALSVDWWKHIDSAKTMGSSIHYVAKTRLPSKNVISKRKCRLLDYEIKALIAAGGLGLLWWRGGKTSRSLFNWKVVPRSVALMAARKGGCVKIPGIHYPDGSENARRSACLTWRASVETSTCVEQLALQVRELDLFVRWDDIENTHPHYLLDKESLKSIRLFKKVIVRKKSIQGTCVKYLLDFGKRRFIPDVVQKHGLKVDESSDERKKFWLEESYMPLHLLRNYEEKRISRKAGKENSSKACKGSRVIKKSLREKGFDYLFSRAEKAESYQCGHCNKNVHLSEAVSCRHCNGFFHKRHVMKVSQTITAGCTYICHRCRAGKRVKTNSVVGQRKLGKLRGGKKLKVDVRRSSRILRSKANKKGKASGNFKQVPLRNAKKKQNHISQQSGNVHAGMTLRRSARRANNIPLQSNCYSGSKESKSYKSKDVALKETPKVSSRHKKRTHVLHSFWLKGFLISRKPDDERVIQFKKRKLLVPPDISDRIDDPPKCALCPKQEFISASTYIGCESCGDWFHGDAFGLDTGNIECVMGFKCHVCLGKIPPVCPFVDVSVDTEVIFSVATMESGVQDSHGLPKVLMADKETDCVDEFRSDKISMEVQTGQSSDVNFDFDEISVLNPNMESGPPTRKEDEAQAMDMSHCDLKVGGPMVPTESISLEANKVLTEDHREQSSDVNLNYNETPVSDAKMESGSLASENEAQATESHGDMKLGVLTVGGDSISLEENKVSGKVQIIQSPDGNLDHGKAPVMDTDMENRSTAKKMAETQATKVHHGDLKAGMPVLSGESISIEENKSASNESKLMLLDERQSHSSIAEGTAINSQNGVLEVDVSTASCDISILEKNKNFLNDLLSAPSNEGEFQSCKFELDAMEL